MASFVKGLKHRLTALAAFTMIRPANFHTCLVPRAEKRSIRVLKKTMLAGCSKTLRYKAPEILRSEAYLKVRRREEG